MFNGCAIKQEADSNNKCNGRKGAKSNLYASMNFAGFVFSFYCYDGNIDFFASVTRPYTKPTIPVAMFIAYCSFYRI